MKEREALKLAREHIEGNYTVSADEALAAIDKALAQPEQEPVAKYTGETWCGSVVNLYEDIPLNTLLYTTPPQRTWVGLTDEEVWDTECYEETRKMYRFARAIEAKLKEKNQ